MNNKPHASSNTVLYISHGGGPLPLLGDESHKELVDCLKNISSTLAKPSAILLVSAHWECDKLTITSGTTPSLIYDYYGFPANSYEIEYPAPGDPALAHKIFTLLRDYGIDANLDDQRGFDHGLFVPLKIMYPEANIPCIQLSLVNSLNPVEHIRIGEALTGLKDENILVIGSGFSFHNLKAIFSHSTSEIDILNESFEQWLVDTCSNELIDEHVRERMLIDWESAPGARYCHPREEHLLPLHVCYGLAKSPAREVFTLEVMNKKASTYLWQDIKVQ